MVVLTLCLPRADAGDQDFICNWLGNRAWTQALPWASHDAFVAAPVTNWTAVAAAADGATAAPAGELQTADGFAFLRVFDAGHMVPMNQPEAALAMINGFVDGTLF